MRETIDRIGRDAGFQNYTGLAGFWAGRPHPAEAAQVQERVWHDEAMMPAVCAQIRQLMAQQLSRHRIASAFGPEVEVAAKSGGLMGLVRNEIGVVTYPDRRAYAAAVFTRSVRPGDGREVDAAIGRAARLAVTALRDR